MKDTTRLKELFRIPVTADKLTYFRILFESNELTADLALALLKVIHSELSGEKTRGRSVYKTYAEVIQSLRYRNSVMLGQIVDAWNEGRTQKDPEWLSEGMVK